MRKARSRLGAADELRSEYRFDYSKAKPNRFASQVGAASVTVVLAPDVASVFRTSASVNRLLRSVVAAIPRRSKPGPSRGSNKRMPATRAATVGKRDPRP